MSYSAVGADGLIASTFPNTSVPSNLVLPLQIVASANRPLPSALALPGCVTQAVHDAAVTQCKNLTVKGVGLGVVGYEQYNSCALAAVPICAPNVMRTQPPPATNVMRTQPPPATTFFLPQRQPLPAPASNRNLIIGGLLAVLVIGGGVVAYRTMKKKPAASAG